MSALEKVPSGYQLRHFTQLDSTNSKALQIAETEGRNAENHWIWADKQTSGRGRAGRCWASIDGNLFASLLLFPNCEARALPEIGFVAGIALFDAIASLSPEPQSLGLVLKWPNDALMDQTQKVAGILLESRLGAQGDTAAVVGFGVNICAHPKIEGISTTCLADHDLKATSGALLTNLMAQFALWYGKWDHGGAFPDVRKAWLERSMPTGTRVSVKSRTEVFQGIFAGIDENGALQLDTDEGRKVITAGDVYPAQKSVSQ